MPPKIAQGHCYSKGQPPDFLTKAVPTRPDTSGTINAVGAGDGTSVLRRRKSNGGQTKRRNNQGQNAFSFRMRSYEHATLHKWLISGWIAERINRGDH
jgi:hypothetical protein